MTDQRLLVVLQNAYERGTLASGWNPSRWRKELRESRSGRRLAVAIPGGFQVHYTNASPVLGRGPDSRHEADPAHLRRSLRRVAPTVVLACGRVAEQAIVPIWEGPLVVVPHPAFRLLTNTLLERARELVADPRRRVALRQLRGEFELEDLAVGR